MPTRCSQQLVNDLAGGFLHLEHEGRLSSLLGLICKGLSHKHNKNTQSGKLRRQLLRLCLDGGCLLSPSRIH